MTRHVHLPDGTRIPVHLRGKESDVLLVMGLGADHHAWDPLVALLQNDLRCIIYDQRGTGDAEPLVGPSSVRELAGDAADILDDLGGSQVHVVGASLGGAVAMELAAMRPDLVGLLTLVSTWHRTDVLLAELLRFRIRLLESAPFEVFTRHVALTTFGASAWDEEVPAAGALDHVVGEQWSSTRQRAYVAHVRAATGHDCADRLATIDCPTLIVAGGDDRLTPLPFAHAIHERVSRSVLEVVPGAGHALALEQPEFLARSIRRWTRDHEQERQRWT